MYMRSCGSEHYNTFIRAQTHESGILPYPLCVFFAGTHRVWVQLPSLLRLSLMGSPFPI